MKAQTLLRTYNWLEAFGYAGQPGTAAPRYNISTPEIDAASRDPFTVDDVEIIFWMEAGENDGDPWRIGGKLLDGRFFYLEAWCDFTGWDCQAGGWAKVVLDPDVYIRLCVPDHAREFVREGMKLWTATNPTGP